MNLYLALRALMENSVIGRNLTPNCISSHFQSFNFFSVFLKLWFCHFAWNVGAKFNQLRTSPKMNSGGVSEQAVQHFTHFDLPNASYNKSFKSKQHSNVTGVIPNVCIFDMQNHNPEALGRCSAHLETFPPNSGVSRPPNHPPEGCE